MPPSPLPLSLLPSTKKAKEIVIYKFITPPLLRPPRRLAHLHLGRLLACSSPPSALPQVSLARKECSCCCCCWHLFACCYQVYLGAQQQQKLTRRSSSSSSVGSAGDVLRLLAPFLGRVLCMRLGWVARQNSFVNTRSQHTHRQTHKRIDCRTHTRTRTQRP